MVQSHIPFRIADTGYRISRFVCFEDYKHTDIHPLASSFRVGDFCNPHSRPMGTSGSPSYGEIQRFERSRPLYDYPVIDSVSTYIDQRVRVSAFKAEQTLTKDTVPVNVDAVVYWTVWDVEKAALEVQEYQKAIEHITQTGLRDTIGKHELSDLLQERDKIAEDLQQVLDRNTNPWGITCQTVGIKDIAIPQDLAEAMSKEAQAERERRARVILGTAETEIAEKFEQASKKYTDNPVALHLRGMNMLFEGLKEKGSMVIVPSSALDTMNLGAMGGLVSLAKNNETPK